MEGYQQGVVGNGGKGTGNKKHKWQVQNRQGEVKNSIGYGDTKELMYKIHRCELRWGVEGMLMGRYVHGRGGEKNRETGLIFQQL